MRELLRQIDRWLEEGERVALAMLVDVGGTAPRPAGACMAVAAGGRMAGSISGGCVEGDLAERAREVLETGRPALVRYAGSEELEGMHVGLSCGGSIRVLVEPFAPGPLWQELRRALEAERDVALAVALAPEALLGRKLLAAARLGVLAGSIDPRVDPVVADRARELLAAGREQAEPLLADVAGVRVFIAPLFRPERVVVVGATHTAVPLARMAKQLGFHVTVVDPRPLLASRERFPEADELVVEWPEKALAELGIDADTYVVALAHDPKFDVPALAAALRAGARYAGAIGSRRTHEKRKARLRELGFSEEELARIHSPVGLDIGGRRPEEIALAAIAEIVAVRHGRNPGFLRDKVTRS